MKLGLMWGYWGAGPPPDVIPVTQEAERLGFDSVWIGRVVGLRRLLPAGVDRRAHLDHQAGHRRGAAGRPHPDGHGHGGHDHRPPLQRPLPARPGRVGPAGGRGLVRPPLEQAAGPHPRVRRDHPPGAAPGGAPRLRRRVLPAPVPRRGQRRAGQAAAFDRAPAARRPPHLPRRRGAQERGHDRRDRRRLAPALLLAPPPRGVRRVPGRRQARASRSSPAPRSTSTTTSRPRCCR